MKQIPQLDKIQSKMQPGVITLDGFLGSDNRNLTDVLAADRIEMINLQLDSKFCFDFFRRISDRAADIMEAEILLDDRYYVSVRSERGRLPCPWGDGLYRKGDTLLKDDKSGLILRWNPLTLHMMNRHGFLSGRGSKYRLEPAEIVQVIN